MVDWFIQVFKVIYQLSDKTFFLSVQIMDNFLATLHRDKVIFPHNYLYLLGITSVYIAAKVEEIDMIPIEIIVKDLGHSKFTK